MTAALVLFWAAIALVVYTYVGFPLLVLLHGRLAAKPVRLADIEPTVSVVVAAYNEAAAIGAKVENLLALDFPSGRIETIIASDGSDDGTNEIVAALAAAAPERLRLLTLPRAGKAATLNAAVGEARGEILVFSDANSMYAPDAVRALVRPFADPAVGGVAGDQRYLEEGADGIGSGEQSYWSFDRRLKEAESRGGSVVSATGAIYAIRRDLFTPVRADVTDDFYTSTGVVAAGTRLVFSGDAVAYEPVASSGGAEFGRKVRVMTRGLRGVVARRALLNPFRHGFYAVQLLSHKLLRRLMVVPLAALAVTSPLLWGYGALYMAATVAQAVVYGLGLAGLALAGTAAGRIKPLAIPAFFCLVNAAAAKALWNVMRGNRIDRWQTKRTGATAPEDVAWRPEK